MRTLLKRLVLPMTAALTLAVVPQQVVHAQKALVYCPVSVDASGCTIVKAALTASFPDGVDLGFDGTAGTVDLKSADLFQYSVFVVPSLAETDSTAPYALLRDAAVASRLKLALIGRRAFWSGTPDQGMLAATRPLKDALIRNLAAWASASFGTVNAPGLVVLQDNSDVVSSRYSWVQPITGLNIIADPKLASYSSVQSLSGAGNAVLTNGGSTLAYGNMASYGFQTPTGAAGLSLDAVGQTGTSVGGQVVLITQGGANTGGAVVQTDQDDYSPGTPVIITGTGFGASETVSILLHEDPTLEPDITRTATTDANGAFTYSGFSPDREDVNLRFILTVTGLTSGRQAQTTFTDGDKVGFVTIGAQSPASVSPGGTVTFPVSVKWGTSNANGSVVAALSIPTPLPAGIASFSFSPASVTLDKSNNTDGTAKTSQLTIVTSSSAPSSVSFTVLAFNSTNDQASASGAIAVTVPTCTAPTVGITPATLTVTAGQSADFTASASGTGQLAYQWYKGTSSGTPLAGKTSANLQLTNTATTDAGTYTVVVTNGCGSASASVALTVNQAATSVSNVAATPSVFGGTTTLTAKVIPAVAGSVAFFVANSATAAAGSVSYDATTGIATLAGYTHGLNAAATPYAVKAVFTSGNPNFAGNEGVSATGLTVAKANASITLTPASLTQTYDGNAKTVAYSTTPAALLPADVVIAYSQSGSPVATPTNAGSYAVDATLTNPNYQLVDGSNQPLNPQKVSGTLTINPASVSIALSGLTGQTFDGAPKSATATPTPNTPAIVAALNLAYAQSGAPVASPTNAGSYDVTVTSTSTNYTLTGTTTGTLVIDQAVQSITWNTPADITYGTALSPTQLNASTNGGGALTYTPAAGTVLNAGPAQMLKVDAAATQNYKAAASQVSINVLKAQATVLLSNLSVIYDGSPKAATATTTPAGLTVGLTYDGAATAPTNAGTYAVVATVTDANYQGGATGSLVIAPAQATLTLGSLATTYDGTPKVVGVTTSPAGLSGVAVTYDASATAPTNAGSYAVLAKLTNPNYTASDASGTLVIARAKPTFSALLAPAVTYGDATGSISGALKAGSLAAIGTVNVVVSGSGGALNASATIDASGNFTATINPSVLSANSGGYPIALSTLESQNFEAATDNSLKLIVNKANQSVAVVVSAPSELTYGAADATLTATGGNGTGAYTFSAGSSTGCSVTGDKLTVTNASSSCSVTASRDGDTNYNPSTASAPAGVILKKATAIVKVTGYSGIYDGAAHGATGTAMGVKGEDLKNMLSLGDSFTNVSGGTATWAFSGGNNYDSQGGTVAITITKRPATVTPNAATKVYGENDPPFTGTLSNFVGSDNVTATYARTAGEDVTANQYTISATLTAAGGLGNYDITSNTAIFTITPATPTISVSGGTFPYDGLDHPATGSVAGVNSANLGAPTFTYAKNNGSFSATLPNGAGTYAVKANFVGGGNYGPALEKTAEILITPKPVTSAITASDKQYDGTTAVVSPVGCSLTGTVGTDDGKVGCSTSDASFDNANAGDRTVTATVTITGVAKDNYTPATSSAAVAAKITKAPSVTAVACSPSTVTYTGSPLTPCSALATGAGSLSAPVTPVYTNNINAGTASVSATYAGDDNHTGSTGVQTFTIARASSTTVVSVNDASYDGSQHGGNATVTGDGGLNSPVTINYTGTITFTNASYASTTPPTDAGLYTATATFAGDANHNGSTDNKTFKITNAAPVITLVTGPSAPVGFGSPVPFTGSFTDPGASTDKYTIVSKWTTTLTSLPIVVNGSLTTFNGSAGTFTLSPTAGSPSLPAGVYTVKVTVTDRFGAVSNEWTMSNYTVVYDPTGGFVTGGGWIVADNNSCVTANAPTGVCTTATGGRANFGFISKYQKGATAPSGNTEFQFQSGNMNFKSTAYQWLVIAGAKAQYKGTGTINGGSTQYNFLLTAVEGGMVGGGGVDKFRIKITNSADQVVFDNQMNADEVSGTGSPLGGGNIQIQAK